MADKDEAHKPPLAAADSGACRRHHSGTGSGVAALERHRALALAQPVARKLHPAHWSSISLSAIVALLSTATGLLTARATELYSFRGKALVHLGSILPLLLPGTVFAMGIQITLIRLGLSDTVVGVVLVHLICAAPYSITILTDVTRALGSRYEEQAAVLGAAPLRAFWEVSFPALLPGILSSFSMAFIISYSQYFTTLMVGGGRVKTISLVLVPYIQSGDRALSSIYSAAFVGSALLVFFIFEAFIRRCTKGRA